MSPRRRTSLWFVAAVAMTVGAGIAALMPALAATDDPGLVGSPAAQPDEDDLANSACRAAILDLGDADVRAAGLGPQPNPLLSWGNTPRQFRRDGAAIVVTGALTFELRDAPKIPVRFECRYDRRTQRALSATYTAVDAAGTPLVIRPVQLAIEHRMLGACVERLASRLDNQSSRRGDAGGNADVEIAHADVRFTPGPRTTELTGAGRARFGTAYEWQGLTFTCRYDGARAEATRSSHTLAAGRRPERSLTTIADAANTACMVATRLTVFRDAYRRGYPAERRPALDPNVATFDAQAFERELERFTGELVLWPHDSTRAPRTLGRVQIDLPRLGTVKDEGQTIGITGNGSVRFDPRHKHSSPVSFACTYDVASKQVATSTFRFESGSWAPSGEQAPGVMETIVCDERDWSRRECRASIQGNVRLLREFGTRACVEGTTWQWRRERLLTFRGCAAEFEYQRRD